MDVKIRGVALKMVLVLLLLCAIFQLSFSEANQLLDTKKPSSPTPAKSSASAFVFPIHGNVYPLGHYTVDLYIGNPSTPYNLDIDSGSDLTWVECDSCRRGCRMPKDKQYKLNNNNVVKRADPLCAALPRQHPCRPPNGPCVYNVEYFDGASSAGVLVRDLVTLKFSNGSSLPTRLAFGCGYDQQYPKHASPPTTAGILGLGLGSASILSQLKSSGLIRNVVGHCLSGKGGFIFFGDGFTKLPGLFWTPISSRTHYSSGPANLLFNGKPTSVNGLEFFFDSGTTYTYLNPKAYKAVLDLISNDLRGTPLTRVADPAETICWKGSNPFNYFKTLTLSFTKSTQLQLPPAAYLFISNLGNACLGILQDTTGGLGDTNIIGDISLQGKLVIYDNEKRQIGWVARDCNLIPNKYVIPIPTQSSLDVMITPIFSTH